VETCEPPWDKAGTDIAFFQKTKAKKSLREAILSVSAGEKPPVQGTLDFAGATPVATLVHKKKGLRVSARYPFSCYEMREVLSRVYHLPLPRQQRLATEIFQNFSLSGEKVAAIERKNAISFQPKRSHRILAKTTGLTGVPFKNWRITQIGDCIVIKGAPHFSARYRTLYMEPLGQAG